MIQVEMNGDIHDFSPKIISIFDKRQLACLGIALLCGSPVILYAGGDPLTRALAAGLLMMPAIACGWVKMYGMPLERFLLHILRHHLLSSPLRKYRTENNLAFLSPGGEPEFYKEARRKGLKRSGRKKRREDLRQYGGVR